MKRVCAWCRKELGHKPGPANLITHGICDDCLVAVSMNPDRDTQSYLDRIPAPILLVNSEGVVVTANKLACTRLHKKLPQIQHSLGGDVMECAWSRLPGGCGRTEHCQACIIRDSVLKTLLTGRAINRRRAYQVIHTRHGNRKMRLLISTQKINDVVLLRIDDMGEVPEGEAPAGPAPKPARKPARRPKSGTEGRRSRKAEPAPHGTRH